jgi:hypothetical protein
MKKLFKELMLSNIIWYFVTILTLSISMLKNGYYRESINIPILILGIIFGIISIISTYLVWDGTDNKFKKWFGY